MSVLDEVRALAFQRGEAARANAAIDEVRQARAAHGTEALSYELALPGLDAERWLLEKALPKLVYFLDCRGVHPPSSGGVFVSLFAPDGLWFIEAGPLVELLARARSLTLAEVVRRYGDGGAGEPLRLGGSA